jgi:hypothetical protein
MVRRGPITDPSFELEIRTGLAYRNHLESVKLSLKLSQSFVLHMAETSSQSSASKTKIAQHHLYSQRASQAQHRDLAHQRGQFACSSNTSHTPWHPSAKYLLTLYARRRGRLCQIRAPPAKQHGPLLRRRNQRRCSPRPSFHRPTHQRRHKRRSVSCRRDPHASFSQRNHNAHRSFKSVLEKITFQLCVEICVQSFCHTIGCWSFSWQTEDPSAVCWVGGIG